MAAANAQIGVARAAYSPSLTLTPVFGGYESTSLGNLISTPSLIWSIGAMAGQTLFDGGRTRAGVDFAQAGYAAAQANYRQAVLTAIQEAQDAMGTLHGLESAQREQDLAVKNQNQAYQITLLRYREGLDSAITLATVEQNQLAALRTQSQIPRQPLGRGGRPAQGSGRGLGPERLAAAPRSVQRRAICGVGQYPGTSAPPPSSVPGGARCQASTRGSRRELAAVSPLG